VDYILGHSGASVVVHGRDQASSVAGVRDGIRRIPVESTGGAEAYESFLSDARPEPRDEPVSLEDPCLIMYTSGTTGRPKGAVLTHGNMTWACVNQILGFDIALDERTLALGPLFHIGGLNGTVNPTLLRGGCVVMVRGFTASSVLELIESQRVNSFFAVPTMLDAMAREPRFRTADLSSLRTVAAAGAPLPLPTLQTWLDRGVTVQQAYGMTEAAPSGTVLESRDAVAHVGSAGKAQFFTDVRVNAPDGEVGEVLLSGPNIMAGYWNDPAETASVLQDGWYHSGDAGSFDENGYLYIRDRYRDMFISGGENVYPAEVESVLLSLPGIDEAAVIGIPDPEWGEVGLAFCVGTSCTAEELRTALKDRLAAFKIPRQIRFLDALPKTATGKIRKGDLRRHAGVIDT
jgi:fatty-acyl-CoA synthase